MEVLKTLLTKMNCFSDKSIQKMIECFNNDEHRTFWIYFGQTFNNKSNHLLIESYKLRKELNKNNIKILDYNSEIIMENYNKCDSNLFLSILNDVKEIMTLNDDIFNEMISSVEQSDLICLWKIIINKLNCNEKQQIISILFDKLKNSDQKQYELFIDSYYLDTDRFFCFCELRHDRKHNLKQMKEEIENGNINYGIL